MFWSNNCYLCKYVGKIRQKVATLMFATEIYSFLIGEILVICSPLISMDVVRF